jgi:hypothetical protein
MSWLVKPYFAVPNFGGNLDALFVQSWTRLVARMQASGMAFRVNFSVHDSLISRGRNRLAHDFLKSDCTHLFFLDADISFEPDDVLRLIEAPFHVCGAAYPKKANGAGFNVNPLPADLKSGRTLADNGWLEVAELATGCLCIGRPALVQLAEAHPELLILSDLDDSVGEPMFGFFVPLIDPETRRYLSEDYAFCQRWRKLGGVVMCYGNAVLAHTGRYTWQGSLIAPDVPAAPSLGAA